MLQKSHCKKNQICILFRIPWYHTWYNTITFQKVKNTLIIGCITHPSMDGEITLTELILSELIQAVKHEPTLLLGNSDTVLSNIVFNVKMLKEIFWSLNIIQPPFCKHHFCFENECLNEVWMFVLLTVYLNHEFEQYHILNNYSSCVDHVSNEPYQPPHELLCKHLISH